MSYTLDSKCNFCKKAEKCTDQCFVQGAIAGIHSVNDYDYIKNATRNRGHLGGGQIKIDCQNFEAIDPDIAV
jgi:hypothetical protein